MTTPPASLGKIAQQVELLLTTTLDQEIERWTQLDPELAEPISEIRRLVLVGGKRLRPAFCYWGYVGLGGSDQDKVVQIGAAIELLHAMALFHDDIMDGAATRRGDTTTHLRFEDRHVRANWAGEARRFGEGAAILIGDMAFVLSDRLVSDVATPVRNMWDDMRMELNVGQYLDMLGSARRERSREVADRICRYKSGKYTIERPLHIGALLAHPNNADTILQQLSAYGLPLGDAFQMRDDVLGAFGDESVTGKSVGGDLREGKPTPLLACATQRATTAQLAVLHTVGQEDLTDGDIATIQQVIIETGALDELEDLIASLRDEAISALAHTTLGSEAVNELNELAHYVADRDV